MKLTKNSDPDKHAYTGYGTGFDVCWQFSSPHGGWDKYIIIFGVETSSPVHLDNKKNNILVLGEGLHKDYIILQ